MPNQQILSVSVQETYRNLNSTQMTNYKMINHRANLKTIEFTAYIDMQVRMFN